MTHKEQLSTSKRILMGPGPSDVHPRVLKALSTPLIGHLDPEFVTVMDDIKTMTKEVFQTKNPLTFVVSAPGSAGMETCLVNLLEPGDEAIICIHGVFGERMADIAERCGANVIRVEAPWGSIIEPEDVKKALKTCNPKLVSIVHAETSTGVLQPIKEIGTMVREADSLFVVDAVTSLGGTELKVDAWNIDAAYSGSQKCLSAPPGLSPVTFSNRAVNILEKRKIKVQSWFLDLSLVKNYWEGAQRSYHHTAPVSAMFAMREALQIVLEEGLKNRWDRHVNNHLYLVEKLEEIGFDFLVEKDFRLPMLNAVIIPQGVDEKNIRNKLLTDYNIEIGAGLGKFSGKVWRIGLMGESSSPIHVNMLSSALHQLINSN